MPDLGMICVGSFLIVIAAALWLNTIRFLARSVETTGTVVRHVTRSGKYGSKIAPVVQFHTPEGKLIEFTENVSSDPLILIEGHDVKVAYDRENPERARIKSFQYLHLIPLIVAVVGLAIIVASFPPVREPVLRFIDNYSDGFLN
jgi:hypothetical protein